MQRRRPKSLVRVGCLITSTTFEPSRPNIAFQSGSTSGVCPTGLDRLFVALKWLPRCRKRACVVPSLLCLKELALVLVRSNWSNTEISFSVRVVPANHQAMYTMLSSSSKQRGCIGPTGSGGGLPRPKLGYAIVRLALSLCCARTLLV